MLNEWKHPKSGETRLYVAQKYIQPVATKFELNPKDIKAWFAQPQGNDLPNLKVVVKGEDPIERAQLDKIRDDLMIECGLYKPVWTHLMDLANTPPSNDQTSNGNTPDNESEPVEQSEEEREVQYKRRAQEAGRLNIAGIKVKGPITVEVDHRETKLMESLLNEHPEVAVKRVQLELADYRIVDREGNELLVERKRCTTAHQKTDLESSIQVDARLFDQSERLKFIAANSDHQIIPILLLEGDVYSNAGSMIIQAIDGAISFLATAQKLSVWSTYNATHSAYTLIKLASHFLDGLYQPVSLHRGQKPAVLFEQKRYLLEALPGVSTVIAEALLKEFGTVAKVLTASESQLAGAKGIGPKTARNIYRVLH